MITKHGKPGRVWTKTRLETAARSHGDWILGTILNFKCLKLSDVINRNAGYLVSFDFLINKDFVNISCHSSTG